MNLGLKNTLELSVDQWSYISKKWAANSVNITALKNEWLSMVKDSLGGQFDKDDVELGCFYCDFCHDSNCLGCPGKLVDESFDCSGIHHSRCISFYRKIVAINQKFKDEWVQVESVDKISGCPDGFDPSRPILFKLCDCCGHQYYEYLQKKIGQICSHIEGYNLL